MAYRIANADTTLSSVTGWDTVTNSPTVVNSSNVVVLTTALYTATFTAPNVTNKCTGVAFLMTTKGAYSSGNLTLTATLQENSVDTAATVTLTINTTATSYTENTWVYFRFPTPYQFTSTTIGYYRFKLVRSAATTATIMVSDGAAKFAYMATDDRTGAIASTDDLLVLGVNYADTTVTWDGTTTIGSGVGAGAASVPTNALTRLFGLYVGAHGIVNADTAASVTTTCAGNVVVAIGGKFNVGSSGTEYPSSLIFKWIFSPGNPGDYSFVSYNGDIGLYGTPKSSTTLWKTTYVSGVGTAANPLIVADPVDWNENDEIYICATSDNSTNWSEGEYRLIKTKNSSTSFVLATTVGGAEAALTYTHNTNAYILNIERNIIFTTTAPSLGMTTYFNTSPVTNAPSYGSAVSKWVRFENTGTNGSLIQNAGVAYSSSATATFTHDYCVSNRPVYCGFWGSDNSTPITINGLIICRGGSSYMLYGQAMANKTFNDTFLVDGTTLGLSPYASSCTFNRLIINAVRKSASSSNTGAFNFSLGNNITFNDCEAFACGTAVAFRGSNANVIFNDCNFGMKGKNAYDIAGYTSFQTGILFNNCNFGSNNFWNIATGATYRDFFDGSEVSFNSKNTTTNNHSWYTPYGIASATGSGLSDTLVRTPGSLNVRIAPESASPGFSWAFLIPANVNQVVPFSGYFLKNVAMGTDVCTVSLFLPGNPITGTPDDTVTLSDNVSNAWTGAAVQAVSLAAYYTGSVDAFATVVINAKSTTAGAYLYCADFYNSGDTTTLFDKLAGLTIWEKGKPSPIITQLSLGGIAPAVWGVALSGLTTAGTTGKKLKDALTTSKFIGLK